MSEESAAGISLNAVNHVGIRIKELDRSVEFYRHLGFQKIWYSPHHKVAGLRTATGIELNLIVNSDDDNAGRNVLMDVEPKYPGYTHVSFHVSSIEDVVRSLERSGIAISEGPIDLGGEVAVFVRDPDRNVIELAEIRSGA